MCSRQERLGITSWAGYGMVTGNNYLEKSQAAQGSALQGSQATAPLQGSSPPAGHAAIHSQLQSTAVNVLQSSLKNAAREGAVHQQAGELLRRGYAQQWHGCLQAADEDQRRAGMCASCWQGTRLVAGGSSLRTFWKGFAPGDPGVGLGRAGLWPGSAGDCPAGRTGDCPAAGVATGVCCPGPTGGDWPGTGDAWPAFTAAGLKALLAACSGPGRTPHQTPHR